MPPPAQRGEKVRGDLHDGGELGEYAVQICGGDELGASSQGSVEGGIDICKNVFDGVDVFNLGFEIAFNDLIWSGHGGDGRLYRN